MSLVSRLSADWDFNSRVLSTERNNEENSTNRIGMESKVLCTGAEVMLIMYLLIDLFVPPQNHKFIYCICH